MQDLYDYAAMLGVRVEYADLSHLDRTGDYCKRTRVIRLHEGMMPRKTRHVLAHELAHAVYEDEASMFIDVHRWQEDRADEWAAHLLIGVDDFREAEERHSGHIPSIAADLYVLEKTVRAFMRTLTRIGDTVYVNAKQGAGQWENKFEVA